MRLIVICCGFAGLLTCVFLFPPVTIAKHYSSQQKLLGIAVPPLASPTPSATANKASLTLSEPTMDSSPIGHPGTKVDITGQGFTANSTIGLYTTVDPNQCKVGGALQPFSSQTTEMIQGDGTFTLHTIWPKNADQPGTAYYICALWSNITGESAISGQTFSVAQQVTVSASTNSVHPGDLLTITGDNWLPPQQLQVSIVPSQSVASANNAIASTTATPDNNGHFSANLTIENNAQPGQYMISVVALNEPTLTNQSNNASIITVIAQATVTPVPTSAPIDTPTPIVTPSSTDTSGGSHSNGGVTVLAFALGGLGLLCVIVGGIMFAVSKPSS